MIEKGCSLMDNENEKEVKKRITSTQVTALVVALIFLILGLLVGSSLNLGVKKSPDFKVLVDGEEQVFRDDVGRKLQPIIFEDNVYIPVSSIGTYMGYMPIVKDGLYLYSIEQTSNKVLKELNTKTYDGEEITDSIFSNSKYTIFILWATWCKDCERIMPTIAEQNNYFKENDIQLVSVETSMKPINFEAEVTEEEKQDVYSKSANVDFKYFLYRDNAINSALIGNAINIPKFVIFDNEGNVIKILDRNIEGKDLVEIMKTIAS